MQKRESKRPRAFPDYSRSAVSANVISGLALILSVTRLIKQSQRSICIARPASPFPHAWRININVDVPRAGGSGQKPVTVLSADARCACTCAARGPRSCTTPSSEKRRDSTAPYRDAIGRRGSRLGRLGVRLQQPAAMAIGQKSLARIFAFARAYVCARARTRERFLTRSLQVEEKDQSTSLHRARFSRFFFKEVAPFREFITKELIKISK